MKITLEDEFFKSTIEHANCDVDFHQFFGQVLLPQAIAIGYCVEDIRKGCINYFYIQEKKDAE